MPGAGRTRDSAQPRAPAVISPGDENKRPRPTSPLPLGERSAAGPGEGPPQPPAPGPKSPPGAGRTGIALSPTAIPAFIPPGDENKRPRPHFTSPPRGEVGRRPGEGPPQPPAPGPKSPPGAGRTGIALSPTASLAFISPGDENKRPSPHFTSPPRGEVGRRPGEGPPQPPAPGPKALPLAFTSSLPV